MYEGFQLWDIPDSVLAPVLTHYRDGVRKFPEEDKRILTISQDYLLRVVAQ